MKMKNLYLAAWVMAGILFASGVVTATDWVAQPDKSLNAEWSVPEFAGRDCWLLMFEGLLEMEGVKDEPFIQDSGIKYLRFDRAGGLETLNTAERAAMAIRTLELYDTDDKLLPVEDWRLELSSDNPEVQFYYQDDLRDGNPKTACVAVGDEEKLPSDETIPVTFTITPQDGRVVRSIVFMHGLQGNGRIGEAVIEVRQDGRWDSVEFAKQETPDRLELILASPLKSSVFRITCANRPVQFVMHPEKFPLQERLRERPFDLYSAWKKYLPGIRPSQMDKTAIEEIGTTYPDTFIGFILSEWDSMLGSAIRRVRRDPDSPASRAIQEVFPIYTNRFEAFASVNHYFNYYKSLFHGGRIMAHSGSITWPQYAAEWGADALEMQLSGSVRNINDRLNFTFTRSAGRQYGIPWSAYLAVFSDAMAHPGFYKSGHGKAPSLFLREWIMGYYLGATFFTVEGQSAGTLTLHDKDTDVYSLSPHGEKTKKFYEWINNPAGARGTSYTPMLFLADIYHGRTGRHGRGPGLDWKIWQDLDMEDGDYMFEHFVFTVDKFVDSRPPSLRRGSHDSAYLPESPELRKCVEEYFAKLDPDRYQLEIHPAPYSPNQRNSPIGDIVDVFFANPPSQGGAIKKEHLDKYAVAIMMGDIQMNDALAARLTTYVKEGGTLVINSAQCHGLMDDPEFLGLTIGTEIKDEDEMKIMPVVLQTAEVVMQSAKGTPLVTRNKYGDGAVLVTTPRYMLLKDRQKPAPLIEELLVKLQDEVLPIRFAGNCQFMLNKIAPDRWHAVIINNQGVVNNPELEDTLFLGCYDSTVTLDAPAGVKAREVFTNADLDVQTEDGRTTVKVLVPAGQVRVVEFNQVTLVP